MNFTVTVIHVQQMMIRYNCVSGPTIVVRSWILSVLLLNRVLYVDREVESNDEQTEYNNPRVGTHILLLVGAFRPKQGNTYKVQTQVYIYIYICFSK